MNQTQATHLRWDDLPGERFVCGWTALTRRGNVLRAHRGDEHRRQDGGNH